MRILVLDDNRHDLPAIEGALRLGGIADPGPASIGRRYAFAGWTLDGATRELLSAAGVRVDLTSSEFDLLLAFVARPGRPLSRGDLLSTIRGRAWNYFDRSIDTLVARLRKKLAAGGAAPAIRSVRSVGYVFCASVSLSLDDRA